jgi:hypothetical protein
LAHRRRLRSAGSQSENLLRTLAWRHGGAPWPGICWRWGAGSGGGTLATDSAGAAEGSDRPLRDVRKALQKCWCRDVQSRRPHWPAVPWTLGRAGREAYVSACFMATETVPVSSTHRSCQAGEDGAVRRRCRPPLMGRGSCGSRGRTGIEPRSGLGRGVPHAGDVNPPESTKRATKSDRRLSDVSTPGGEVSNHNPQDTDRTRTETVSWKTVVPAGAWGHLRPFRPPVLPDPGPSRPAPLQLSRSSWLQSRTEKVVLPSPGPAAGLAAEFTPKWTSSGVSIQRRLAPPAKITHSISGPPPDRRRWHRRW